MNGRTAALREILAGAGGPLAAQVSRTEQLLGTRPEDLGLLMEWAGNLRVTRNLSPNTAARYLGHATKFFVWLRIEGLDHATARAKDVEVWLRDLLLNENLGPSSRSLALTAVKQFYAWREGRDEIPSPVRNVRGPKRVKTVAKKHSDRVLKALFGQCDRSTLRGKRDYALLLFLWGTGARREEASLLALDQLELHERSGKVQFLGKGAKERVVPFEKRLVDALMEWLVARDELRGIHDPLRVWINLGGRDKGKGMSASGIESLLRRLGKNAGLSDSALGAHRFRVTFATDLYDQGVDIEAIRRLLGHESIETTRKYIAVSRRMQAYKLSTDRMDSVIGSETKTPAWLKRKLGDG